MGKSSHLLVRAEDGIDVLEDERAVHAIRQMHPVKGNLASTGPIARRPRRGYPGRFALELGVLHHPLHRSHLRTWKFLMLKSPTDLVKNNIFARRLAYTVFSNSALCLTVHWKFPISVTAYVSTRPTSPASKPDTKKREKKKTNKKKNNLNYLFIAAHPRWKTGGTCLDPAIFYFAILLFFLFLLKEKLFLWSAADEQATQPS